jgi:hypothetical protein
LIKGLHISYCIPLKLTQILRNGPIDQPRVRRPVEREEWLVVRGIHYIPTSLSATDSHKGILIIFVIGAIQAKQTPKGLGTQGNNGIGKQFLYVVKGKENGH